MDEQIEKLKKEMEHLTAQADAVRERTVGYIVTALGLVAGLAWNDAISSMIKHFFPIGAGSLWMKFLYAAIVTAVVVIVSTYIVRFLGAKKEE